MTVKPDHSRTERKPHPVSRAEFARRASRSPSSITEACEGPLRAACLPSRRIDASHEATVAWAEQRGIDAATLLDPVSEQEPSPGRRTRGRPKAAAKAAERAAEVSSGSLSEPADISELLDCTLREILARFHSVQGFGDWLDRRKKLADVHRIEFNIATARGLLIPRDFVRTHVVSILTGTNQRLLVDTPRTLCRELYALAKSGTPIETAESTARKLISKQLQGAKERTLKAIRAAGKNTAAQPANEERLPDSDENTC